MFVALFEKHGSPRHGAPPGSQASFPAQQPGVTWDQALQCGGTMKLSARNQISGKVVDVQKGQTTSHVRVDVGRGVLITASITNEAVDDLGLKSGDAVTAIIKASDVMIGK
jgi:molybdopterin-binding protein